MKKIYFFIIFLFASILFLKIPAQAVLAADECRIEITDTNEVQANQEFTVKLQSPPSGRFITTDNDNIFEVYIDGINNIYHDKKDHRQGVWGYIWSADNDTTVEFNLSLPSVKDPNGEAIDGIYSLVANVQYRKATWGFGGWGIKTKAEHATCKVIVVVKTDGNLENAVEFRQPEETSARAEITPLNPIYDDPQKLDPEKVYGSTKGVMVKFAGLIPKYSYRACLHTDFEKRCMTSNKFQIEEGLEADEKGEIVYPVPFCGNGKDSLKTGISSVLEDINNIDDLDDIPTDIEAFQCDKGDYFHEGSKYKVTLFTADYESGPIASADFYVYHVFPDFIVNGYLLNEEGGRQQELQPVSLYSKYLEHTSNGQLNSLIRQILGAKFEIENHLALDVSAYIKNKERNAYQVVIESADRNHRAAKCILLYGENNIDKIAKQTIYFYGPDVGGNLALGPIPPGLYNIYLSKQVNRGDTSNGSCQGGFTYYKIPLSVEQDKNNTSITKAIVDFSNIQVDPNQEEIRSALDANTTNLPCVEGKDANNENVTIDPDDDDDTKISKLTSIVECTRYGTAIGSFGTDPLGFISSVGTWLFRMGAIVALVMMMYAGFQFQTSRGDKEKIGKAREMLTSAITGLIFIVLAVSILQIIGIDILKIPGFTRGTPTTQESGSGGGNG